MILFTQSSIFFSLVVVFEFFARSSNGNQLVLAEFTTMAGRRLRDAIKMALISGGGGQFNSNVHIVIAGLTNTYSQYVTTFEEYQVQRYEVRVNGASFSIMLVKIILI